jgi:hypothetical protein
VPLCFGFTRLIKRDKLTLYRIELEEREKKGIIHPEHKIRKKAIQISPLSTHIEVRNNENFNTKIECNSLEILTYKKYTTVYHLLATFIVSNI